MGLLKKIKGPGAARRGLSAPAGAPVGSGPAVERLGRRKSSKMSELFRIVPTLALIGALVIAVAALLGKTVETTHFQHLRRKGAFFLTGPPPLQQRLAAAFGKEVTATTLAPQREGQPLRYVPNSMVLANSIAMQEWLQRIPVAEREVLKRYLGLDLATAALLLRTSGARGNGSQPEVDWIHSLPSSWPFIGLLTTAQKTILQGTKAERPIEANEELLKLLQGMHLEGRTLSATDAEWILGFYLHHNVEGHFVPGLLDGLLRHWDLHRCSPLARDVAATGRLPGWAVLAGKGMKTGEEVFLCSEQPNGQLWAMYGIIYPENPHGAALTQGTISDSLLDAMLQQAQLTCRRSEVRTLLLRSGDLLSASNLRCASVLWLGGGEAAFHALQAGYFDSWPRPPGATFAVWREAEGRLYRQLVKECNSSKMVLSTVDAATLEEVKQDRSQVSKSALLVREMELQLFQHCIDWSSRRLDVLEKKERKNEKTEKKDYTEL